ncbi:hypothetical protein BDZ89DRAFT_1163697 [Hymenopellis radicata]|nr:hypothetical protein BDZ89DRAFT_1163697 [Hymenopellis radicata]
MSSTARTDIPLTGGPSGFQPPPTASGSASSATIAPPVFPSQGPPRFPPPRPRPPLKCDSCISRGKAVAVGFGGVLIGTCLTLLFILLFLRKQRGRNNTRFIRWLNVKPQASFILPTVDTRYPPPTAAVFQWDVKGDNEAPTFRSDISSQPK